LGGFVGPFAVGWLKDHVGGFQAGLIFLGVCLLLGSIVAMIVGRSVTRRAATAQPA
jgi:ACS family tartrate transporter-like MFS transporter